MALPTKDDQMVLETFRERVADILSDDQIRDNMFLLRWLRARDMSMDKAEDMLRNAIKWRKENRLDEEIKMPDPYLLKNFPHWLDGIDKDGRPVICIDIGKWDVRKLVREGRTQEFLDYLTYGFEECLRGIKRCSQMHPPKPGNPPITQFTSIYDWEGIAWSQIFNYNAVQTFLQLACIYEAYYPEILHACYFINTPPLISSVLTLLKPVVAPRTMSKIKCLGSDKEVWKQEILKVVDADQIRPQFGGTKDNDKNPFLQSCFAP